MSVLRVHPRLVLVKETQHKLEQWKNQMFQSDEVHEPN